ncbi:MAG: bifunctional N-acetylglucosamine-1-phosphate uridyltransferase/glucosamine-1-phosphate acetyltransferase [uncultured bacterium (gcode 4)]|uniref:Bifunctional N-acetylglucosamine-1-phosphate uridyltransferase/glucosamine-1-phosphate acetyltransferase n=1 Tax=uncultured bacterium (gcode 4) TaxID=1234023 RepID=K2AE60_9BACT|nr:MAG: bifunctional N-acetylglucosamine-1-phosphate uridyltransferase/glucosamine-1-phosphate acetyltransferase [uncultured bacterium (gcode 4)]
MEKLSYDLTHEIWKLRWSILKYSFRLGNILWLTNIELWKWVIIEKWAILKWNIKIWNWTTIYWRAILQNCNIWNNCEISCEVKNSNLWDNVKAKHFNINILNADIWNNCNIWAWVVFANYNWNKKWYFKVWEWSFIWSNSTIILKSKVWEKRIIWDYVYIVAWISLRTDVPEEGSLVCYDENWKITIKKDLAYKYLKKEWLIKLLENL